MKKQIFYLASAALVAGLAACSNDELDGNYGLDSDEEGFSASIEQAESDGEADTRLSISGNQLAWVYASDNKEDIIGMYNTGENENVPYHVKNEANAKAGKFTPVSKDNKLTAATYAYYPYYASAGDISLPGNIKANLEGYFNSTAEGTNDTEKGALLWSDGIVKMPMAAKVDGANISFKNTTALFKVTVVDMPASTVYAASLTSNVDGLNLTGPATMNLKEQTLKVGTSDTDNHKTITYVSSTDHGTAFTTKQNVFYFIVPVGDYTNGGLTFALHGKTSDETPALSTEALENCSIVIGKKKIEKGVLYDGTIYMNGTAFANTKISKLNDKLAEGGDASSDLEGSEDATGTIYVPAQAQQADQKEQVTITLKNVGTGKLTIAAKGEGYTPKKVIVKVGNYTATDADAVSDIDLTVNLPGSSVEIAPLDNDKVTISKLTFTTAANVLKIKKDVTVTTLTRQTKGNVYVEGGASVSGATDAAYYIFKEDATTSAVATSGTTSVKVVGLEIYQLLYPNAGETPKLSENVTLLNEVEINVDNVTLDLQGHSLTAATSSKAIVVNAGGKLTIQNTVAAGAKDEGKVIGASGTATIEVKAGAQLILTSGALESTSANTVESSGTFTVNGGTINAASNTQTAIELTDGTATLNSTAVINSESTPYTINGEIDLKASAQGAGSTLTIAGSKVSGQVKAANSTLNLNSGSVASIEAGNAAQVNINGGNSGAITENNNLATKATITIAGGDIVASSDAAITLTKGSEVIVNVAEGNKASITGAAAAVSVQKGTLEVKGAGTPTFKGEAAISAKSLSNAKDAKITLSAAKAEYIATGTWAINNSTITAITANTLGTEKAADLNITAGYFDGDVVSDAATYFIKGGYFKRCGNLSTYGKEHNWFVYGYGLTGTPGDSDYVPVEAGK